MDRLEPVATSGRRLPPGIAYLLLFLVFTSTFRVFATLPLETLHQTLSSVAIISLTLYYIGSVYVEPALAIIIAGSTPSNLCGEVSGTSLKARCSR